MDGQLKGTVLSCRVRARHMHAAAAHACRLSPCCAVAEGKQEDSLSKEIKTQAKAQAAEGPS